MNDCGTCRHWKSVDDGNSNYGPVPTDWQAARTDAEQRAVWLARNGDVGVCKAAIETWEVKLDQEVPLLMVQDGSAYSAVMFTREKFGCVLWEAK